MNTTTKYESGVITFDIPQSVSNQQFYILVDGEVHMTATAGVRDGSRCTLPSSYAWSKAYFEVVNGMHQVVPDLSLEAELHKITEDIDGDTIPSDVDKEIHAYTWDLGNIRANNRVFVNIRGHRVECDVEPYDKSPF